MRCNSYSLIGKRCSIEKGSRRSVWSYLHNVVSRFGSGNFDGVTCKSLNSLMHGIWANRDIILFWWGDDQDPRPVVCPKAILCISLFFDYFFFSLFLFLLSFLLIFKIALISLRWRFLNRFNWGRQRLVGLWHLEHGLTFILFVHYAHTVFVYCL